jgi:D-sedoheptulose 7-phosphate isomerase
MRVIPDAKDFDVSGAAAEFAEAYSQALSEALARLPMSAIGRVAEILAAARDRGAEIFLMGNGGAAASASHLACDLGAGASGPDRPRFRVRSLGENRSWSTALANDIGYAEIFVEELKNFARPGDVCVAMSCSGRSPNVLRAIETARNMGLCTVAICGGGPLAEICDETVLVNAEVAGVAEDLMSAVCHMLGFYFIRRAPGA